MHFNNLETIYSFEFLFRIKTYQNVQKNYILNNLNNKRWILVRKILFYTTGHFLSGTKKSQVFQNLVFIKKCLKILKIKFCIPPHYSKGGYA